MSDEDFEGAYAVMILDLCKREKKRKALPRGINELPPREERDAQIIDYIRDNPNAAAPAIVKATGISEGSIADYLSRLTEAGVINRTITGRFKNYNVPAS